MVCDEENYEGQNSFIKEQVIQFINHAFGRTEPKTTFTYPYVSVIRKKWYDVKENLADLTDLLKGKLFLQYYQHFILTQRCCFQSCSIRNT